MQTAEEFADTLERECITCEGHCWDDEAATALIEADRNATRLALLAECREWLTERGFFEHARNVADLMLKSIETKYRAATQPVQLK